MNLTTTARNATLADLIETLQTQRALRYDVVAPASLLAYEHGDLVLKGSSEPIITDEGVTIEDVKLTPTDAAEGQLVGKDRLNIDRRYTRRMREEAVDLLDTNVNHWLQADPDREFLIRGFKAEGETTGICRAVLSPSFSLDYDHYDGLATVLQGIRAAGVKVGDVKCDLTNNFMRVRIDAPSIAVLAPELLRGYRSPFDPRPGDQLPLVNSGLSITNSETGGGSWKIAGHITVQICGNGATSTVDAISKRHLGARMDAGIQYRTDTQAAQMEAVKLATRDAVSTFLSEEWLQARVDEMTRQAGREIAEPEKAIKRVGKTQGIEFTESEISGIFSCFIKGGQMSAGGVMQAVTAHAQEIDDPARARHLEEHALEVLAKV